MIRRRCKEVPEDQVDLGDVLSGKYLTGLAGKIAGATVVTIGAFEDARITITEDGALVASSYGMRVKDLMMHDRSVTVSLVGMNDEESRIIAIAL